ncbi:MAG: hypothetical protein JNM72_04675 [Deltaproteobacteria bacterium]|nr:hypothetical protein [Deltaproteobacteria bacterium]
MARPRWSLEIELDEPLLVPPVVGVAVVVRGPGLHQRGRLRAVAAVDPDGAPRPAVVSDPAPRAAGERAPAELLRVAGERLRLHLEEGAPVDHPALRAAADAAALWWEEEPARAAEVELLRARCLLAALEPAAAARAARPWVRRDGLPLLLRARLMAVGAWAAAEAGAADEAAVELDEALGALERRPRSCPEGVVLGRAVAALRAQLWVEGGTQTDRAELALLAALGPPEGWLALPEDPADAEGEVALLRWALSGACAPALRSALVKRHARWARRGGGLTARRALLLRALLLEEEGLPLEAAQALRAASRPDPAPTPRGALLALAAARLRAPPDAAWQAEADALERRCPGAAPHLDALRQPDPLGPRRARLGDLPLGLR